MRYVDTGSRQPKHALGTWLSDVLMGQKRVVSARVQSGYFGGDALGYLEGTLQDLARADGQTCFLIGSNDGSASRSTVANLLKVVGPARPGLRVGVVSFQSGLFHPKVFHFERADGSATAYIGSANLTVSGTSGKNVEAAMILDSSQGDSQSVLGQIADAIDAWFAEQRPGLYPVSADADLDQLVAANVLDVPAPSRPAITMKPAKGGGNKQQPAHSLKPLVAIPATSTPLTPAATPGGDASPASKPSSGTPPAAATHPRVGPAVKHWSKKLSPSDAQRRAGHQSALIALTQGTYRNQIDQTRFFRYDLFGDEKWVVENTISKGPLDVAYVPIRVTVDGVDHSELVFRISHARHRESGTNSPTTELHLEPLQPLFAQTDMSHKLVEIERFADGSYSLTIS